MSARRPRVVALSDSLSLPRPGLSWEDTWPSRLYEDLRQLGLDAEVINFGRRRRTVDTLTGPDFEQLVEFVEPDIVVLQVGIVDCSPRVFSRRSRDLLNHRYFPARLRDWLVARRSAKRASIVAKDPLAKVYVPPSTFRRTLEAFAARLEALPRVPALVVIPIVAAPEVLESKSPGHRSNVDLYNRHLQEVSARRGWTWLATDALGSVPAPFDADGYHLSAAGNRALASVLAGEIAPMLERTKLPALPSG